MAAETLEEFLARGGNVTQLPYKGKPLAYQDWEQREAMRRSTNMTHDKGKRGKGARSLFLKRGAGNV